MKILYISTLVTDNFFFLNLQVTNTSINGGLHTEPKVGNRDRERSRMSSGESERESLLIHENPQPPRYLKNKHLYGCMETGAPGGESDTNSNCALIVEDASAVAAAKSINGNNNYELTEFDTKAPTYRYCSKSVQVFDPF